MTETDREAYAERLPERAHPPRRKIKRRILRTLVRNRGVLMLVLNIGGLAFRVVRWIVRAVHAA